MMKNWGISDRGPPSKQPFRISHKVSFASRTTSLRHFGKKMPQEAVLSATSAQEGINSGLQWGGCIQPNHILFLLYKIRKIKKNQLYLIIISPLYLQVPHLRIQPTTDWKHSEDWRASCEGPEHPRIPHGAPGTNTHWCWGARVLFHLTSPNYLLSQLPGTTSHQY